MGVRVRNTALPSQFQTACNIPHSFVPFLPVTGMSVLVDGCAPLACRCRIRPGSPSIYLCSEIRSADDYELISTNCVRILTIDDMKGFNDPASDCALLKCALVCLGAFSPNQILCLNPLSDISESIQTFFNTNVPVQVEVVSTSLLPQGSGMGTSSILAGCVLASISQCRGVSIPMTRLIHMVLELEQLLTTGGGFQDQANGLVGGIKRVTCSAGAVNPVRIQWETLSLMPTTEKKLNDCLHLVYTGKTRLAKNILLQCLERWSERTSDICQTVSDLVEGADAASRAVEAGDLDNLGHLIGHYWKLKKIMAGPTSGVEPSIVVEILSSLYKTGNLRGASLCGAGGGGFLVLLTKNSTPRESLVSALEADGINTSKLKWHRVQLDKSGMIVQQTTTDDLGINLMER